MCSDTPAIRIDHISKYFEIYAKPRHRLLQMLCRGRRKFFKEYWALRDVSFTVSPGECVGIVGRNGAGKSTLLQIIAGTLTPTSGSVCVAGRMAALLELGSGFNPEFTGRENVLLNAAILGLTKQEIAARFDDIVAFADIGDFIEQPVKMYSSGMTLRLAFAVIAHVDADVLIIDEALAVGDAFFTQKCMRFLRSFMQEKTVIFVSHDANAVCSLCTRAIFLQNGGIALDGSPGDVTRKYLEEIYEERQGEVHRIPQKAAHMGASFSDLEYRDMRADLFNASNLRNDIEVFRFNPASPAFGTGGAAINQVWLADAQNRPLHWVVGGERVRLHVACTARQPIEKPIVGFLVCNKFGQQLFGDNTYLACQNTPVSLQTGESFHAAFAFRMPILAPAEYCMTVAVAEGTPQDHVQHQWMHEALIFVSRSSSCASGLVGIPMLEITLRKGGDHENANATCSCD